MRLASKFFRGAGQPAVSGRWPLLPLALTLLAAALFETSAQAQTGIITTIAGATPVGGKPVYGYSGDGGPALGALVALANVRTVCNPGPPAPDGIFAFDEITHLTVDASGSVIFADSGNQRIRRITPDGIINTVPGSGQLPAIDANCNPVGSGKDIGDGGPATSAKLYNPAAVIVHPNGNLIIADQQNNRIRQVTPDGVITTIAGNGQHNLYSPGIPATSSPMDWPSAPAGIAFDAAGNLYIADQSNHRVRKVAPDGTITTFAGNGRPGFLGDGGPGPSASLFYPNDVQVDAKGNVYIADMGDDRVRRVDPSGIITTVAGNGTAGRGPDGVPAVSSALWLPWGIGLDPAGNLYIVDWQNYLIRKVSFDSLPSIGPGGIVNGASFAPAPVPVAPGSIISIFGAGLAASAALASSVPLRTQLAGTSVSVNGNSIPLFFVSPGQINAQLPFEVPLGTATAVVTNAAGAGSSATFAVGGSAVGLFQFPGTNRAIVLNQDGAVNGPSNPEARGNVIVAFLTGQGPVSPRVPTGQAASASPLSQTTLSVAANIGGAAAQVQFLGLTPGFVGLGQANIQIPANISPGDAIGIYLSVRGQAGNTATISIK